MSSEEPNPRVRVAIVGAGPGGLATAIALSKIDNMDVTIYEKSNPLREVGAGISIGQNTWNVLSLLGLGDELEGHPTLTVLNLNGKTGEEVHRFEKPSNLERPPIRTQRTELQRVLRSKVPDDILRLGCKVIALEDLDDGDVRLVFDDGTSVVADLVVGADGIRSVVRDSAWNDYSLSFTGTTIWRVLLPWNAVKDLDPKFGTTAWWHGPTTHVYFSPVGEGLWEIAARAWQDPEVHGASKVTWGTPIDNATVEANFVEYLPQIREALNRVPEGAWREFAAFSGPELDDLTSWNNKVVLVGDSSHALSGAFGSGAGFAMEDGYVLAQALKLSRNNIHRALPMFNKVRLPYYSRMYAHLDAESRKRTLNIRDLANPSYDDKVRNKIIKAGGADMRWIYENDISKVWQESIAVTT
ncbi:hypothetical protein AC579_10472 [Pseudocercospora musae]|uniref:FAD-binding domain-containing protein n=1 Tax=Pseudocercospora musae TaxID=113226 RepID=A0A139HWL4_9PEZI|nr:hypothetical protein AC579_10472 [Pseudocercospora musae]